jgi:UrcA family protein
MKNNTLKATLLSTLVASLIGMCVPAQAGEFKGEETTTRASRAQEKTVSYGDLNLSSKQGRSALESRIFRAATDVCGSVDIRETGSLRVAARNRRCASNAYEDALSRVSTGTSVAVRN